MPWGSLGRVFLVKMMMATANIILLTSQLTECLCARYSARHFQGIVSFKSYKITGDYPVHHGSPFTDEETQGFGLSS